MCAALPRSDYYEGSAPRPRRRWTWQFAGLRGPGARIGVLVFKGVNPWCGRWSAVPLAALDRRPIRDSNGDAPMTGAPSRRLRTDRALAACSSTWTSCVSIQRVPAPTSSCADLHPRVIHHGTCGNSPRTPQRRRGQFRPLGFCRPPFQSSATFAAPFCIRSDPDEDDIFRSSVPPLLSRRTQPARGRAHRTRRRHGARTTGALRRPSPALARTASPIARRAGGLSPQVRDPRPGQVPGHDRP